MITCILFSESSDDLTENYIKADKVRHPYLIVAGKWVFQLFEKQKHIRGTNEWLFGLRNAIATETLYSSIRSDSHVIRLRKTASESFVKSLVAYHLDRKFIGLMRDIKRFHVYIFGHLPSAFIKNYIFRQYLQNITDGKTELQAFTKAFCDLKNFRALLLDMITIAICHYLSSLLISDRGQHIYKRIASRNFINV